MQDVDATDSGQDGEETQSPGAGSQLIAEFSCNRLGRQANPPRPSLGNRPTS